ncbi:MAG: 2-amino-4-hydroxy-6-hydroxymethyldihydropteridine diphosphokinase [Thiohalocapsa sp.]
MHQQTTAYIAIGSNIDPRDNVTRCLELIAKLPDSRLIAESSWYLTSPWGIESQANFINLVVGLDTALSAKALLKQTQEIEKRLQRIRSQKNGPRTIDLDMLLFGDQVIDSPDLMVPHPALLERDFMLDPLVEIAPDVRHPVGERPLSSLTDKIRYRQIIERLEERGR